MLKTKNDNQVYIDGVSLQKISEMHGTPCYIYSKNSLINEFEEYKKAFKNKKDILICYSVKACSNLNILKIFNDLGSGFDIVSLGELERLKYIGADPKKIVFSGVAKSDEEIKASLEYGILLFNVESIAELENINSIANKMDTKANISIRVNPDIDPKTHPYISTGLKSSKFGIAIDQAIDVYDYANKMNNVIPIGIDAHIGSQIFDIVPFVDSLDKLIELYSKLKKKNIDIIYKPNHKGNVNADLQAFERIMNNLIDNAIKYSKEDSQITISTSNEVDNYIKVMIEDSGQGISDEDKDHIFSRFYRTASARAQENQGSGLGLAIVKHLVNSLNGEVGIESKPNKGSIFWFTVPIY